MSKNFNVNQGSTWQWTLTRDEGSFSSVDSFTMEIREEKDVDSAIVQGCDQFLSVEGGELRFSADKAVTSGLPVGESFYDLFWEDEDGVSRKVLYGKVVVEGQVTDNA